MCAGKGIIHAEMPVHVPGSPDPRGLQLWVDLPKKVYNMIVKIGIADRQSIVQDGGTAISSSS